MNNILEQKALYNRILKELADEIDLTPAQYELARERYEAVADWLSGGFLSAFQPEIKTQGSFRIGTPVRPINPDEEFDIDLTCKLILNLPHIQKDLKRLIELRLNENEKYRQMLSEKRRCWRLHYAETSKFHLDIVPAVPDKTSNYLGLGVFSDIAKHAIKITDNTSTNYQIVTTDWPKSNTEGYALWFLEIMKEEAINERYNMRALLNLADVADVPEYRVRTILQRAIQLMKRHRDMMFGKDENKPISIIITTLAAKAYSDIKYKRYNSAQFIDAITDIVNKMIGHIEDRNGVKWIVNPVNPEENFANKWQEDKDKEYKFNQWWTSFRNILINPDFSNGLPNLADSLKQSFSSRSVNAVFNNIGDETRIMRENHNLKVNSAGIIGSVGLAIPNHVFHGNKNKAN